MRIKSGDRIIIKWGGGYLYDKIKKIEAYTECSVKIECDKNTFYSGNKYIVSNKLICRSTILCA
jgi:hypothetical protein